MDADENMSAPFHAPDPARKAGYKTKKIERPLVAKTDVYNLQYISKLRTPDDGRYTR